PHLTQTYRVESVSRLLTALDQKPEYARVELDEEDDDERRPAAVYRILDRDPNLVPNSSLSVQNIAHIRGEIIVFDLQDDDHPARVHLSGNGRDGLERLTASFVGAVGDLAVPEGEASENGFLRAEHFPLVQDWHFPTGLPPAQLNDLRRAAVRQLTEELW